MFANNTAIRWISCVVLQGELTASGLLSSYIEHLPGNFATSAEALAAAEKFAHERQDVIGCSAKRTEAFYGI
ncbi:hypothetical protein [Delftia tsuruhatensis]|uniref:hypothetical protein n=1 Tax=Delftia tsuruhatensis TaxID=180282 RepID=UPI0030D2B9FC